MTGDYLEGGDLDLFEGMLSMYPSGEVEETHQNCQDNPSYRRTKKVPLSGEFLLNLHNTHSGLPGPNVETSVFAISFSFFSSHRESRL
jgi:hypothetical protein